MRVKRIEAIAVSLPMIKPVKMAFEAINNAENLLVRVETADGTVGWGEAASAPTMPPNLEASIRPIRSPTPLG
ncbi:MAG: hypothetical protein ACO3F9_03130 [Burkholderiales bacterium]